MKKNLMKPLAGLGILLVGLVLCLTFTGCPSGGGGGGPATPQPYTVTFEGNGNTGGSPPADITVNNGASITLPGVGTLVNPGKTFSGWNTKDDGTGDNYAVGASYTVKGNVTLYAKWVDPNTEYTVKFDGNGNTGGAAPADQKAKVGVSITLPGAGALVKTGNTFSGWNAQKDGTGDNYAAAASYTVNANVTLYAKWIDKVAEYTVKFNGNGNTGGTAPDDIKANAGSSITLPEAGTLVNEGKTFGGWNTSPEGTGTNYAAGASYTVNADITLHAKWAGPVVPTNANIRTPSVNTTGTAAPTTTYGLYIGGNPAVSNGNPAADWNGSGISSGTIAGNANLTYRLGSPVVVITEEDTVSKVEFAQLFSDSTSADPGTWQVLAKNSEDGSSATAGKRWVGKLDETTQWVTPGASPYLCYVRITAGDGTTKKAYRYTVVVGNNVAGTPGYCTLSSLSIGGVSVMASNADVAPNTGGTPSGWWNVTAAPNLTAGEVTLPAGTSLTNLAVSAGWTMGGQGKTYNYAVLPASAVPLKEGDAVTFVDATATGSANPYTTNITVSSIENGGYIILRAHYVSNSFPIVGHYLIKVNVAP